VLHIDVADPLLPHVDERTNAQQLYVGMTRGRQANHVRAAPPAFDPDHLGPTEIGATSTPADAVTAASERQSGKAARSLNDASCEDLRFQPLKGTGVLAQPPTCRMPPLNVWPRQWADSNGLPVDPDRDLGGSSAVVTRLGPRQSDRSVRQGFEGETGRVAKHAIV